METMDYKQNILSLKDGESFIIPESDYGKAEIWLKNETYFLFEIPMYGGLPRFSTNYSKRNIDDLINKIESWT